MKWLKYFVLTLFHPIDTFYLIKKDRKHIPIVTVLVLFAVAVVLKILYVYTVNFTVATTSAANANAIIEIGIVIIPIILWAVASYALMTVCGGESTFKETMLLSAYSMVPVIVIRPIMIILSQVLAASEKGFYSALSTIMWVWVILLLYITFKEANNISFWKSIFFTIIIVIAMFLIVVVLLLAFALDSQIFLFAQELWSEKDFLFK